MEFDTVFLSRIQFALTIMFHYLFPPLTIGMGIVLVYLGGMFLWTRDAAYQQAQKFWTKVFGLNFAIGVASGIVMEFQFGTNWSRYSEFVGDIFGAPLAAEGILAFFLESAFLGVLLFARHRVSSTVRWLAAVMVAVDDNGQPRPVPALLPETDDDRRRYQEAQIRREHRLTLRRLALCAQW